MKTIKIPLNSEEKRQASLAMSKGKIKIGLDEQIEGTARFVSSLGYSHIYIPVKGTTDRQIHRELNAQNVKFFFTENNVDFLPFKDRRYMLVGVKYLRVYEGVDRARIIASFLNVFRSKVNWEIVHMSAAEIDQEMIFKYKL